MPKMNGKKKAVVVPCGPRHHDPRTGLVLCKKPDRCNGDVCRSRIDPGIALALAFGCPLVITGDGHGGEDVRYFKKLAKEAGVTQVFTSIHAGTGTTLTDMEGASRLFKDEFVLRQVYEIHLVTDEGHMRRAKLMLKGELLRIMRRRRFSVIRRFIKDGFDFPLALCRREKAGHQAYWKGRYDRTPRLPPSALPMGQQDLELKSGLSLSPA